MQLSTILRSPISNNTKLEKYLKAPPELTCKAVYNTLITSQCFPPPTAEKRLIEHDFDMQERKKYIFPPISRDKRS